MSGKLHGAGWLGARPLEAAEPAPEAEPEPYRRPWGEVRTDTEAALTAATHLTAMDAGAKAALRVLADKVDSIAGEHLGDEWELDALKAKFDNVTLPTYLKYCEALGLTPSGRKAMDPGAPAKGKPTKLAVVRDMLPKSG